jgi:hypothetical protein
MAILIVRRAQSRDLKSGAWGYFEETQRVRQICNGTLPENQHHA